jgi:hypothetical protein
MLAGTNMMTFYKNNKYNRLFLVWALFSGIFGLGVGGEYPLAASNAAAHHAEEVGDSLVLDDEDRRHR